MLGCGVSRKAARMSSSSFQAKGAWSFSWAEVPKLSLRDVMLMLWRERTIVLTIGAAICALGLVAVFLAPKTYVARAELLVRLGQEYVYEPSVGQGPGAGNAPDMQAVVNAEIRLIRSGAVARRTIERIGLTTLYPDLARAPEARRMQMAERAFSENLGVETAPQTPSIALSFKHKNAALSARTLNALIDVYLAYRRDVLVGGSSDVLHTQSTDIDVRAGAASQALSAFLAEHQIGDFPTEIAALAQRATDVEARLLEAQAAKQEAEGRAGALRVRYTAEPAVIELYTESDARRQLVQLQVDREQALSQYQDDAPPVRELDRRIQQLQSFLEGGDPASLTRRGPNPVRQDLASQLFRAESDARAQNGRATALAAQQIEIRERLRLMQGLEPRFQQLQREKTILEQSASNLATRAEEARSFGRILGAGVEAISPMERAVTPTQGQSLRMPIALVTIFLAGALSLAAGLGRGLMRRNFPSPESAARTLDAPVLAVVRGKAA